MCLLHIYKFPDGHDIIKQYAIIEKLSFPLDKNSDSNSRNEGFVVKNGRKNGFHQTENPFSLARMKNSFQKYVSTGRKELSLAGVSEK